MSKSKMLTREEILKVDDLVTEIVSVPEWGGDVSVCGLMGTARDAYESTLFDVDGEGNVKSNTVNARAKLVALSNVDENKVPMFSIADVTELGKKNAQALDRVFKVAQRLSGLGLAAMKEEIKNS